MRENKIGVISVVIHVCFVLGLLTISKIRYSLHRVGFKAKSINQCQRNAIYIICNYWLLRLDIFICEIMLKFVLWKIERLKSVRPTSLIRVSTSELHAAPHLCEVNYALKSHIHCYYGVEVY